MATITWTGSFGGSWTTPTNWNPTGVPDSSGDTATIDAGSAELFSATETVGVLDIGPSGTLLIDYFSGQSGGSLTVTGTLTNDGGPSGQHGLGIGNSTGGSTTVTLGALDNAATSSAIGIQNATVTVLGNVSNNGTDSSAGIAGIGIGFHPSELAATVTVDGSFTNSGALGVGSASTLTIDGTLTNSGSLGSTPATSNGVLIGDVAESFTATAKVGTIDNTATGAMSIQDSKLTVTGNVSNAGAGSDAGFDLEDGASVTVDGNFTNTGKLVLDYFYPGDAGSTLTIDGTLTNSGSLGSTPATSNGVLIGDAAESSTATAKVATIDNTATGAMSIQHSKLTVTGNVSNAGTGSDAGFDLEDGASVTVDKNFTNTGKLALDYFYPADAGSTLTVDGTLTNSGGGTSNGMGIFNAASVVDAGTLNNSGNLFGIGTIEGDLNNTGTVFGGGAQTPGTLTITARTTNSGTLEATAGGGLDIKSNVTNTKTIEALGTNTKVVIDGVTITNTGGLVLASGTNAKVVLENTTVAGGTVEASGTGANVDLDNSTITGATLKTAGTGAAIEATSTGDEIKNATIAAGSLVVVENLAALMLSGGTIGAGAIVEALSGGVLIVTGTIADAGTLFANGTFVFLDSGTVTGGTLKTAAGGAIEDNSNSVLNGVTIAAGSTVELNGTHLTSVAFSGVTIAAGATVEVNGSYLNLAGTIANAGTIELTTTSSAANLYVDGTVTLSGGGKVTLSNSSNNQILSNGHPAMLTNVNNMIAGAGTIGDVSDGNLKLDNSGTFDANAGKSLILDTGTSTVTNTGTLEATASGGLDIKSNVANSKTIAAVGSTVLLDGVTITNTATGLVSASGTGAFVDLENTTISGGKLETTGGAMFLTTTAGDEIKNATIAALVEVQGTTSLTISGGTIDAGAVVKTLNGGSLVVTGTVASAGTLFASGAGSWVHINGTVTGGTAEVGNGIVEIAGASSENVSFQATGDGGLELGGLSNSYTGKVSGFGPVDGGNTGQYIEFADISYTGESFTYTPANSANTSGTLTVTDGTHSASVVLVGKYEPADFEAEDINGTLAIIDPAVYYYPAYTNSTTLAYSSGDLVFESTLTNTGTLEAENGSDIEVIGAVTNSNVIRTGGTGASDINLEGSVSNTGSLYAITGDFTIEGPFTNGTAANPVVPATVQVDGNAVMSIESNISNAGLIDSLGNSQTLLDVTGIAIPTLITNNGTIEAENTSLIVMDPGNAAANTGLVNHGIMAATQEAELLVEAGTSSFTNTGTIEADSAGGLVTVDTFLTNLGTIAANASGAVQLNGSASMTGALGDVSYSVANSGVLLVTGQGSITVVNAASGGGAEIDGSGTVNNTTGAITGAIDTIAFESRSNTNVSFVINTSGLLELGGPAYGNYYSGTISGFLADDAIDLSDIAYTIGSVKDTVTFSPNTNGSGGVLEVHNGSSVLASLNLAGWNPSSGAEYTSSNFTLNSDGHGGTIITDPSVTLQQPGNAPAAVGNGAILEIDTPDSGNVSFTGSTGKLVLDQPATFTGAVKGLGAQNGIDLSQIAFGGNNPTLGYAENNSGTGGTLSVGDGAHSANVALLGNYMASSFVTAADGHGGTLITEASQTAQQPLLAHPHAG